MKQFFQYVITNFQGITGFYLIILAIQTAIQKLMQSEISTYTAVVLSVIGLINVIIHAKKKWDEIDN